MTNRYRIINLDIVFTVFRLLTDFVCLYTYEFWLSLWKIVGSSVILLLPLFKGCHTTDSIYFGLQKYKFKKEKILRWCSCRLPVIWWMSLANQGLLTLQEFVNTVPVVQCVISCVVLCGPLFDSFIISFTPYVSSFFFLEEISECQDDKAHVFSFS